MDVFDALAERKSVRAFLDKPVAAELITDILAAASHAPSGANTQPWQVAVLTGEAKLRLQQALLDAFQARQASEMDYQYYPLEWASPYRERRNDCGMQLYQALDIARDDKERRLSQWAANYRAFDAPVMLLFFLDAGMQAGSFLDSGMFVQSVMLAAQARGLATCPQAALAEYPTIVKTQLGYPADSTLLCGMSMGYEDTDHPVNHYRTPRQPVSAFTRFFDS